MKKAFLLIIAMRLAGLGWAQGGSDKHASPGRSNKVYFSAMVPLAAFQRSHFAGAGLSYSWSSHQFGTGAKIRKLGLVFQGGADYYFGKKINTVGIPFRYGQYLDVHVLAGVQYNAWERMHFSLAAGPVMSLYRSQVDFGLGIQGGIDYYLTDRILVGPRMVYRGHSDVAALYALGVFGAYVF